MYLDRTKEHQLYPSFEEEATPPSDGIWEIVLSKILIIKNTKKNKPYLSWPVEIVRDEHGEKVEGYKEIEWMIFFESNDALLELLMADLRLDKPSVKLIFQTLLDAKFLDGKEVVVLNNHTHRNLLVQLSMGFTPKHRNIKLLSESYGR